MEEGRVRKLILKERLFSGEGQDEQSSADIKIPTNIESAFTHKVKQRFNAEIPAELDKIKSHLNKDDTGLVILLQTEFLELFSHAIFIHGNQYWSLDHTKKETLETLGQVIPQNVFFARVFLLEVPAPQVQATPAEVQATPAAAAAEEPVKKKKIIKTTGKRPNNPNVNGAEEESAKTPKTE
jgi:hypothetical protein